MQAEQLIALAGAHGVDFGRAARMAAPRGKAKNLLAPRKNRANGKATRPSVRPEWTVAELGQAAAGVPELPFMAACYSFAGERGNLWKLHSALFREAQALRERNNWPVEVTDFHSIQRPYLAHLAKLVLDEDASPQVFRTAPQLYAIYLGVSEKVWVKSVAERYGALQLVWLDWLGHAASIMQPRLAVEED